MDIGEVWVNIQLPKKKQVLILGSIYQGGFRVPLFDSSHLGGEIPIPRRRPRATFRRGVSSVSAAALGGLPLARGQLASRTRRSARQSAKTPSQTPSQSATGS